METQFLIALYAKHFQPFHIKVAQSLCERQHFAKRKQFLQLKNTYEKLWENDIIPIANENDVISARELKFSDNDELATLIAAGFGAKKLMICTISGGLLNHNKEIIAEVEEINQSILEFVDSSKSSLGLGGMASKLTFTKLANSIGIETIIFGLNNQLGILSALNKESGTRFKAKKANVSTRNKWLASGGLTTGKIFIDQGAEKAVQQRKSLLAVGVVSYLGNFDKGEIVEIFNDKKKVIAVCRTKVASTEIMSKIHTKNELIAHVDDIVLI